MSEVIASTRAAFRVQDHIAEQVGSLFSGALAGNAHDLAALDAMMALVLDERTPNGVRLAWSLVRLRAQATIKVPKA